MLRGLLLLIAGAALSTAHAASLEGYWSGDWIKAGDALHVGVHISKAPDGYHASFDSDALQVAGIPFREVREAGGKVSLVLQGDATTTVFDGALAGDVLSGTFQEEGVKGTFRLTRSAPPPPLVKREVTFANGGVTLAGELIFPATTHRSPAILFLHGSGAEGRWASRYLAEKFARAGFVALISDKRGVGGSKGDWRDAGFEELADDAVAGIRLLAALPEVDPQRIGIYGHSQGGTIAPLVAGRAQMLAFVIASAASGLVPAETEIYSIENSIGLSALPPAEQADAKRFVRELVDVAYNGKSREDLDAMVTAFRGRSWYFDPPPPEHHYWRLSRRIAGYRPLDHWRKVQSPVLIVFGKHDERVPPRESIGAISGALKEAGNAKVVVHLYDYAGHAFHIVPQDPPGGWRKRVANYADTLTKWAAAVR